jgi:hypothetical protein
MTGARAGRPSGRAIALALTCAAMMLLLATQLGPDVGPFNDIPNIWTFGRDICEGRNPYSLIHTELGAGGRYFVYATYLPGFYLLEAATYAVGVRSFRVFLALWFPVCLVAHVATGAAVWAYAWRSRGAFWLGLALALFLWCNRWALAIVQVAGIEPLALALIVLSMTLWERDRRAACLLFGASLALKQLGVFLLPFYGLWAWQEAAPEARRRDVARTLGWSLLIPAVVSLPFFVWGPGDMIRSILFAVTRQSSNELGAPSIDALLGWETSLAKLPMLALMGAVWLAAWFKELGRFGAVALVYLVYVSLSPVLFSQYLHWMAAFAPLAFLERPAPRDGL